jgi:hypothetical protein
MENGPDRQGTTTKKRLLKAQVLAAIAKSNTEP